MCHYGRQMGPSHRGWELTVTVFWGRGSSSERKQTRKGAVLDQRFALVPARLSFDSTAEYWFRAALSCIDRYLVLLLILVHSLLLLHTLKVNVTQLICGVREGF